MGSSTLPKRLVNQPDLDEFFNIDENLRQIIFVLEGTQRWIDVSEKETIGRLEEMQNEIGKIVELINMKVKK